jgi:hypothetical protein
MIGSGRMRPLHFFGEHARDFECSTPPGAMFLAAR